MFQAVFMGVWVQNCDLLNRMRFWDGEEIIKPNGMDLWGWEIKEISVVIHGWDFWDGFSKMILGCWKQKNIWLWYYGNSGQKG